MKKRTIVAVLCILAAAVVNFLISPLINKAATGMTDVVVMAKALQKGDQITEDSITIVQVNRNAIPTGAYTIKEMAVGTYAKSILYAGDFLTADKVSSDTGSAADTLLSLDGTQVAISFPITSFAAGLSGKLQNGDVISLIVKDEENNTTIPEMLQYVRVITTTTDNGVDQDQAADTVDGTTEAPATVTVLATQEQAKEIAMYINKSSIHVALVCRGDTATAQEYLNLQEQYLLNQKEEIDG